jgi:hypothetical protein
MFLLRLEVQSLGVLIQMVEEYSWMRAFLATMGILWSMHLLKHWPRMVAQLNAVCIARKCLALMSA